MGEIDHERIMHKLLTLSESFAGVVNVVTTDTGEYTS